MTTSNRLLALVSVVAAVTLTLTVSSCAQNNDIPRAEINVFADKSRTGALIREPLAVQELVDAVMSATLDYLNGDLVRLHAVGDLSVENSINEREIRTGLGRDITAIRPRVETALGELLVFDENDVGDNETHIISALQDASIDCSRNGLVLLYSDGVDESDPAFLAALSSGEQLELPAPDNAFLSGCRVVWLALGETALNPFTGTDRRLSNFQQNNLQNAWHQYLVAAGVLPDDISFE